MTTTIPLNPDLTSIQDNSADVIPALEIDPAQKRLYLLQQTLPLGPDFEALQARRNIWQREFTLDTNTLDVLDSLVTGVNQKLPTLLEGPTAASKTSAIEFLAAQAGYTCHRVNLKGQTDTSELLGKFVPNPDAKPGEPQIKWQDGLLVTAMKEGHWIILDEINLAEPQILEAMNSVLEKHPSLTLTDNGGVKIGPGGKWPVHPNFRVFATMNPGYTGRQPFSPAFQNRWVNRKYVKAPDKAQLEAMLVHHSFGAQPEVSINGEKFQSERTDVAPQMERLSALPELSLKTLFSRLANFHESIAKMAEDKTIGRDLDPGHIFTRRDLSVFLDYIATRESFNRRRGQEKNLLTHPVDIIWEALQLVYLNKMSNADDLTSVTNLLVTSELSQEHLIKLFPESGIRQTTRGKIGSLLGDIDYEPEDKEEIHIDIEEDDFASGEGEASEIPPEVESLREQLTADYDTATTNLTWYGILETAEDGSRYYKADYDGSTEKDPNDEEPDDSKRRPCPNAGNFTDQTFEVPTLEKILTSLTPAQAALYNEYKEKGLEPRLQLTPLALKLRTMAVKLDAKKEEINAKAGKELIQRDTYIWDAQESGEIDETTLLYEPQIVENTPDGQQLITQNGWTKSQMIKKYGGWQVEIVAMKPVLEADIDKQTKEITKAGKTEKVELTNAEKTAMYMTEARTRGESGLGYENYLLAQMNALASDTPTPLEKDNWTILPESSLTKDKNIVAGAYWDRDQVRLSSYSAIDHNGNLRFRRSVRVYVKP